MQIKHIVKIFSLYFLAPLSDQFYGNKVLFPLLWTKMWSPVSSQRPSLPIKNIPCAESKLRYLKSQHIHCVEAELWNFKSQNILCAKVELHVTEYSACGISLVPYPWPEWHECAGATGPWVKATRRCCYLLFDLGGGPYWDFCVFSQILSSSNKSADVWQGSGHWHTSWPNAAGTKLPTGSTRQSEGEFSTL